MKAPFQLLPALCAASSLALPFAVQAAESTAELPVMVISATGYRQ